MKTWADLMLAEDEITIRGLLSISLSERQAGNDVRVGQRKFNSRCAEILCARLWSEPQLAAVHFELTPAKLSSIIITAVFIITSTPT